MLSPTDRAYEDFANAIVTRAVDDYRKALDGKGYNHKAPEHIVSDLERFFRSQYFKILTNVEGEYLIENLRQEHEENERRKHESNIGTSNK